MLLLRGREEESRRERRGGGGGGGGGREGGEREEKTFYLMPIGSTTLPFLTKLDPYKARSTSISTFIQRIVHLLLRRQREPDFTFSSS